MYYMNVKIETYIIGTSFSKRSVYILKCYLKFQVVSIVWVGCVMKLANE